MNTETRAQVQAMIEEALAPVHQEFMEQSARLSAQRFLLEIVYANNFAGSPSQFAAFMRGLQMRTAENMTKSGGPMRDEDAIELQARIAAHLERFGNAVELRISQGMKE